MSGLGGCVLTRDGQRGGGSEDVVLDGVSPAILGGLSQAPGLWQASQSLRDCRYAWFRPPFGLWRVTFLCVAKEKSPIERPPPADSLSFVEFPRLRHRTDGPSLARRHSLDIPVSRPGAVASSRRIRGGTTIPCPSVAKWARYAVLKMVGVPTSRSSYLWRRRLVSARRPLN